jgi:hypothetical protein
MGFIQKFIDGIKNMIHNFKRIICFLGSVPRRISNINAGFDNIFKGINLEFQAIGKSFHQGSSSIGTLGLYIGELINTYMLCGFKFAGNFFDCIFYYLVDIILYVLYLPCTIILWAFDTFLDLDFYYIPQNTYKGLQQINDFLYPYLGFHIIHWPKKIREDCYLCKRLKTEAVDDKAKNVGVTFKETIPQNFGKSAKLFKRGQKQFEEIFKTYARNPSEVH